MRTHTAEGGEPAALAVDLGGGYTRIWASGRPALHVRTVSDSLTRPRPLIRRGRISDIPALHGFLARLRRRHHRPVPDGAVLVACRPVLTAPDDEQTVRRLLTEVFDPARLLFIDTVRAAAIGAAAAPGPVLVADVGAQLTEVAVLDGGTVAAARRADVGTGELIAPSAFDPVVRALAELVEDLRGDPDHRAVTASALRGGVLLVGGGALHPGLAARAAGALSVPVRTAAQPGLVAVRGAAMAALSTLRRTAATLG